MTKYLFLLILLFSACGETKKNNQSLQVKKNKQRFIPAKLIESFTDSTNIGRKNLNKLELKRYAIADSNYVTIRFFSKKNGKWITRNEFYFPKDNVAGCDPMLSDFNADGLNDITYVSNIAARGINEVRTLFIYDKQGDKLIHIRNSEEFPNMQYNKELDCIDAWLISGCNTTVFLKLEADSLREFASVNQCDSLTVKTYDKHGAETMVLTQPTVQDEFIRFKNFSPLKQY